MLKARLDSVNCIRENLEVTLADFYSNDSSEHIAERIAGYAPDYIGFSIYVWNRHLVLETCHILKTRLQKAVLFAGGAEATAFPDGLLKSAPFDFVIKGESEYALTEAMKRLLEDKIIADIPGVYAAGELCDKADNQWPVADLDSLPSPFLTGAIDPAEYDGVLWELSRGCAFSCSFCFESRGIAGVRRFSLGRLKEELALFEEKKVNNIFVLDPTFNHDIKRAKKILRMILEIAPRIHFTFEVRSEFIDKEIAELFSMLNCTLQIGLQSAIPDVLSRVNRKISPDAFADKIALLNASGVIFGFDLIYGLPGDNFEGFKHSLDYALRLQPNHLDIFPLAVLPGTALYDEAGAFHLHYLPDAPYTLISSPGFTESDMADASNLKTACEIFYNQGGAVGWLFIVLETLDMKPSDFMDAFREYLLLQKKQPPLTRQEICLIQCSFIQVLFIKHDKGGLYPVMNDIIRYHCALNDSLYAGPCADGGNCAGLNEDAQLKLSPGTFPLVLKYNCDELMSVGEYTLDEFMRHCPPHDTYIVVYNREGEVRTMIIDHALSEFLQSLPGSRALRQTETIMHAETQRDLDEFITYARAEKIIY